jgi:general secretion pathway protein A
MLLMAFGHNQHKIGGKTAERAIRELARRGASGRYWPRKWNKIIFAFILLCVAVAILLLYRPEVLNLHVPRPLSGDRGAMQNPIEKREIKTPTKALPPSKPTKAEELSPGETVAEARPLRQLENYLAGIDRPYSRHLALKGAIELWEAKATIDQSLDTLKNDQAFFRLASQQNGLLIRRIEGDIKAIKNLNLPAILAFHHPGGRLPVYLTLIKMDEGRVTFKSGVDVIETGQGEAESYWTGVAYIPWKDFLNLKGEIPSMSTEDSITTLKILLRDIGFSDIEVNARYDERTRDIIKQIQAKHGLKVDGLVGVLTKIVLYNEKKSFDIPHIAK